MSWHLELEKALSRWSGGDYVFGAFAEEQRPPQHIAALEVGTKIHVGRAQDCEMVFPALPMSRRHCEISRDEAGVWVRDLQSRSGTYLNGKPLPQQAVPLYLDDVVHLSNFFAIVLTARFTVSPAWRDFQGGLIAHLSRGITTERRVEDLPILADALEDAGCDLTELLQHLRHRHQRDQRCWVVKRLLRGLTAVS